jgi:hypothetical protein
MTPDEMTGSGYVVEKGSTFYVDLEAPEDTILARMRSTTRNYIRQAARKKLQAEISTDVSFADEYDAQLHEVFLRQGLVPTYGLERVRRLIENLQPTGQLLLLRISAPNGKSVATGIFIGRNRTAVLWGAAFLRAEADLHPNELLHWEAMRHWRARGASRYDMGGSGEYKAKYGGVATPTFRIYRSRFLFLRLGRAGYQAMFAVRQNIAGRVASTSRRNG